MRKVKKAERTKIKRGADSISNFIDLLERSYEPKYSRKRGIKLTNAEQQQHHNDLFRD